MFNKKKSNVIYQKGKGFKKVDSRSSIVGEPNTNVDFYDIQTGNLVMRRKINDKGVAQKDLDKGHKTHNYQDHAHDYYDKKRGNERPLSKKEKRELKKASKKRRFP